jgi:hypothetical protein
MPFLHPFRVRRYRMINMLALAVWGLLALVALMRDLAPDAWISGTLSAIALYFFCAGILRGRQEHAKNI